MAALRSSIEAGGMAKGGTARAMTAETASKSRPLGPAFLRATAEGAAQVKIMGLPTA